MFACQLKPKKISKFEDFKLKNLYTVLLRRQTLLISLPPSLLFDSWWSHQDMKPSSIDRGPWSDQVTEETPSCFMRLKKSCSVMAINVIPITAMVVATCFFLIYTVSMHELFTQSSVTQRTHPLLLLNIEYVCGYVHRGAGTHRGQKESKPLGLVTGGCELPKMSAGKWTSVLSRVASVLSSWTLLSLALHPHPNTHGGTPTSVSLRTPRVFLV